MLEVDLEEPEEAYSCKHGMYVYTSEAPTLQKNPGH
jgi:hypothetical protein